MIHVELKIQLYNYILTLDCEKLLFLTHAIFLHK